MRKIFAKPVTMGIIICFLVGCSSPPQWTNVRDRNVCYDLAALNCDVELPFGPLSLEDILNIALERNLDLMVKEREIAIQNEIATRELYKILPRLTVSGEYSERNKEVIEKTKSIVTGNTTAGAISRERFVRQWDATIAWSVLDFGLAYYRSRQEKNRGFMACLEYHRVRQNLVFEITNRYWEAIVALRAIESAKAIQEATEERQQELKEQIAKKIISETEGLRNEDKLIAIQIELQSFERKFKSAKAELAKLMALPPGKSFDLAVIDIAPSQVTIGPIEELESLALHSRPELFAQDVQECIMIDEVRAALLEMFPNATLFTGMNYDGDRFIVYNEWLQAGIRATWNLLSIPQHIHNRNSAQQRVCLARKARLQLSIGVITQVRLALLRYQDTLDRYQLAVKQKKVKADLLQAAIKESEQGIIPNTALIDFKADALFAEINAYRIYAETQIALEQINNTIGIPLRYNNLNLHYTINEEDAQHYTTQAKKEPHHSRG